MKYCTYCGKQLEDNETCTCRQQATGAGQQPTGQQTTEAGKQTTEAGQQTTGAEQQPTGQQTTGAGQQTTQQAAQQNNAAQWQANNSQAQQYTAPQGQQYNAQGQQYRTPQGQPYNAQGGQTFNDFTQQINAAGEQLKQNESVAEIMALYKGLIKTPVEAISKFVKNASTKTGLIFIVFFAIMEFVLTLVNVFGAFIDSIGNYTYRLGFKEFIGSIFSNVVGEVADVLVIGVVLMLILNTMQKEKKVSFGQTLTVACLYDAAVLPVKFIANVVGVIPFSFFSRVNSWGITFACAVGYVYLFFGLREIEDDDNNMPLVYGVALVAAAICSTVINLVF